MNAKTKAPKPDDTGLRILFSQAQEHGKEELEMEVGDLQEILRIAWEYLTPGARMRVVDRAQKEVFKE